MFPAAGRSQESLLFIGGSPPCRGLVGWLVGRHVPLGSAAAPFGSMNKKPSAAEPLARIAARPARSRPFTQYKSWSLVCGMPVRGCGSKVGPCRSRECRAAVALLSGWGPCDEVFSARNWNSRIREQCVLFLGGQQQVIDDGAGLDWMRLNKFSS